MSRIKVSEFLILDRAKLGWILSASLHVGVVVVAFVGLPYLDRPLPTPTPPIAIEFVKIDNNTRQLAPKEEALQEAAEEKPQRQNVAAVENTPPPAADAVPLPTNVPTKKATPKPKPKPKVSEARKLAQNVRPRAKPRPPSRLKSSRIAALIDRSIKQEKDVVKKDDVKKVEKKPTDKPKEQPNRFAGLRGRIATASLRDALSQKLSGCWTFPRGAKGIENMQVTVRIWLRPDGTLSRPPEFVNAGNLTDPSRAFFRVFAESARRAVRICEPFNEASQYIGAGQKYIDFNFNGAEFAGG